MFVPETVDMPRIEGELTDALLGHRVMVATTDGDPHLEGLTGFVRAIKPQPLTKRGVPVAALKYTHYVQFDPPWPDGRKGAWFKPDELEDLGGTVDGQA